MKRLILFRHAKSGWEDAVSRDFDRPLNERGRKGAKLMGQKVREFGPSFDHVLASPAIRVVETIEEFEKTYGTPLEPEWEKRIYLASCMTLLDVLHDADDRFGAILMVGHNPGLEDMVLMLVPDDGKCPERDEIEEKLPTSAIVELTIDCDRWADIQPRSARITRLMRPRDFDPDLGPHRD